MPTKVPLAWPSQSGRAQTGKGWYQKNVPRVLNAGSQGFNLGRAVNNLQSVTQPLHRGSGHENRTFQSIGHGALSPHPGLAKPQC